MKKFRVNPNLQQPSPTHSSRLSAYQDVSIALFDAITVHSTLRVNACAHSAQAYENTINKLHVMLPVFDATYAWQ